MEDIEWAERGVQEGGLGTMPFESSTLLMLKVSDPFAAFRRISPWWGQTNLKLLTFAQALHF